MTAAQQAVDNIISDLQIRYSEGPLSEFEIALYNRKAQNIMSSDPVQAHCVLGMLGFLEENETKMRENHIKSIALAKESGIFLEPATFNYGCSLCIMGYYAEGLEFLIRGCNYDKTNLRHLNAAIKAAYQAEDHRLDSLLTQWAKLNGGESHPIVNEIDKNLTDFCMISSQSSLAEIWDTPEEDEAWKHLQ